MDRRKRRWIAVGGVPVAVALAFMLAAWATAASGEVRDIPPDLPVAALPAVQLDAATIGQMQRFHVGGLDSDASSHARLLSTTSLGPLYVLPSGNGGVCLVLDATIACGNPDTTPKKLVALFEDDPSGNMVGGVVTASSVGKLVVGDGAKNVAATPVTGGFVVDAGAGLSAARHKLVLTTG